MGRSSLTPELFTPAQVEFLRSLGVRVEPYTNRDGSANQSVFNDRADVAEGKLRHLRDALADLLWKDGDILSRQLAVREGEAP